MDRDIWKVVTYLKRLLLLKKHSKGIPNWQMVPEALSSTLPQETLQKLDQVSLAAVDEARELEAFRSEFSSLLTAVQMLPPETQEQMNLDPARIEEWQQNLPDLNANGLAQARNSLDRYGDWRGVRGKPRRGVTPHACDGRQSSLQTVVDRGDEAGGTSHTNNSI